MSPLSEEVSKSIEENTDEKIETTSLEKPVEEKPLEEKAEDDMLSLLDEHLSKFKAGEIIEGTVEGVDEKEVMVDIGFKYAIPISIKEFSSPVIPEMHSRISVYIEFIEPNGRPRLSKKKADFLVNLKKLEEIKAENKSVDGILRRRVKGGMIVDVLGVEAFLPGSQISNKPIPNLDQFIGKNGSFKIIKIDHEKQNIIVSRKKLIQEEEEHKVSELKEKIKIGAELDGIVRNITDYGAFIDLGGIDGLLHITDMSWGHVTQVSDMLNIGDKLKVKVLNHDEDMKKISLGLKQLVPHPWENIGAKYPEGATVTGKVVNLTNYGAFIELEPGVEGLVHVTELSWTKKIKHPKQMLTVGDTVKAIVINVSKEDQRISLGIKQMEANPWITIEKRYPVDTVLEGVVRNITPFGIFVEIEENIEGLIHISDISWTKRIYNTKKLFKKGEKVTVKVLSIDKTLHRIALGIKQLTPDPWEHLDEKLPINREITAKIVKLIPKGVLVDVEVDNQFVEGFVPLSHLGIPELKKVNTAFEIGEELPLKIIELDLENRRLILSVKAFFFAKGDAEYQNYLKVHRQRMEEFQSKQTEKEAAQEELPEEEQVEATLENENPIPVAENTVGLQDEEPIATETDTEPEQKTASESETQIPEEETPVGLQDEEPEKE
jgi:small subunit ribosomal protein S1